MLYFPSKNHEAGKTFCEKISAQNKSNIAEKHLNSDWSASLSLNCHRTCKILIDNDKRGFNRINSYNNIEERNGTSRVSSIERVSNYPTVQEVLRYIGSADCIPVSMGYR